MKHFLLLISLFISTMMMAGPVDQETAKQKAMNFVANKMGQTTARRNMKVTSSGVQKASNRSAARDYLHIFNIDGGGYVIVSGDDRTEEILGYSTTGTFDAEKIPENMRAFLQEYVDGIQYLDDHHMQSPKVKTPQEKVKGATRRAPKASIEPLIKARWNQGEPFDQYCPVYNDEHAATGCVATAYAQIMNHHKWPSNTTTEIPAYTSGTRGFNLDAVPAGTAIDWNNIKDKYGWVNENGNWNQYTYTDAEAQAVANLMKLCGRAVQMDYYCDDYGSSGAVTANCIAALVKYFDYEEETCKWLDRVNYSYSDWQDIIYAELAANRPVLYSGQSAGGGHAFVCDGYGSDDFFHINWGWGGMSDGFFRLRILNPDDQGIGGSSTSDGYGMGQGAGIGIQKNDGTSSGYYEKMSMYNLTYSQTTVTRTSSTDNFSLSNCLTYYVINSTSGPQTFNLSARILNNSGQTIEDLTLWTNKSLNVNYYSWSSIIPDFGANYADGKYKLVFIAQNEGETEWYALTGSETMCVDFTISGNTLEMAVPKLEVSHEIVGDLSVNSAQTIKINIKNTGMKALRSDLYYQINSGNFYGAGFIDAEPNTTSTVEFQYTPTSAKTYTFTLDPLDYQFNMTIGTAGGAANVTGAYNGASPAIQYDSSSGKYYVAGTSTIANFTIQNTGDADYNNNIVFNFFYYSSSESKWKYYKEDVRSVTLAPGASQDLNVTIDKVENSDYSMYYVEMEWIVNNKETFLAATPDFEFRSASGGGNYNLTATDLVGNPDLQYNTDAYIYYINGTESTFSIDITNTGSDAFSGQLQIEQAIHYAGGGDSWYYKDYPTYPETRNVTIPAGSTQRFSTTITKSTDVTVDMYFVRIGYKGSNESSFETLKYTPNFVFVDANTPYLVFKSLECNPELRWDNDKRINYVYGDKLSASFYITNVGGGAFDGKVKFIYYGIDSDGNWTQIKPATTQSFYVAGESTAVATSDAIEKTDGYPYYTICCYYIDPATGKEIFLRRNSNFEFRTQTYVIETGDYGCTPEMKYDNATYTSYIEGSKATFFGDIKNIGVEDFSGQLKIVKMYHSTTTGYWNYITSPSTQDITIAAGATKRVYIDIEKLDQDDADLYWLCVYYKDPNESDFTYLLGTPDFEFRASSVILGDANGDGSVNVTDIVATVNYIMEKPSADFNEEAADVNQDGYVNVTDIVGMVNIIMEAASRWDANANKLAFSGKSIMLKNLGIEGKVLFDSLNDEKNNSNDEVGMSDILREGQMKH